MSFDVAAEAYDRFMGRYSRQLSAALADLVDARRGDRALDVGCGPGALLGELARRLGDDAVEGVEPSPPFVAAARARFPQVVVHQASADRLPFPDRAFDVSLAQLVFHFVPDPVAGLAEMARVSRRAVAASVWDFVGERSPVSIFWRAAGEVEGGVVGESSLPGAGRGHLVALFEAAGLHDVREVELRAAVAYPSFEDWWCPYELGVGPAGAHARRLSDDQRAAVAARCRELLPAAPFVAEAVAWAAVGRP